MSGTVDIRNHFDIEMEIEVLAPTRNFRVSLRVLTAEGVTVFTSADQDFAMAGGADMPAGATSKSLPGSG